MFLGIRTLHSNKNYLIMAHYILHSIVMNTVAEEIVCGAKPVLRLVALVSVLIQIEIGATNGEGKGLATTHARKQYDTCQIIFYI